MVDGKTGYMESPKNHQEYANRVLQLLDDNILCDRLGNYARMHIEQNFSQQKKANQNAEFYKKIIDCERA